MSVLEFASWAASLLGAGAGYWGHGVYGRPDNSDRRQTIAAIARVAGPILALVGFAVASAVRSAQ